jgi:hypothetical protein
MPTNIKTDEALLKRLSASAKTKLSKDRLWKQRVSFIYGGLPSDSPITRAQVESALAKHEGGAA